MTRSSMRWARPASWREVGARDLETLWSLGLGSGSSGNGLKPLIERSLQDVMEIVAEAIRPVKVSIAVEQAEDQTWSGRYTEWFAPNLQMQELLHNTQKLFVGVPELIASTDLQEGSLSIEFVRLSTNQIAGTLVGEFGCWLDVPAMRRFSSAFAMMADAHEAT